MDRKEQLMKIFSVHIREILTALPVHIGRLQEIRLRAGRPLMILYDNKEYLAGPEGNIVTESSAAYHVSAQEIQETMTNLSHYSIYAYAEEIRQGFLTILGGFGILLVLEPLLCHISYLGDNTMMIYVFVLISSMRSLCSQFVRA